jgi:hypothetical protein
VAALSRVFIDLDQLCGSIVLLQPFSDRPARHFSVSNVPTLALHCQQIRSSVQSSGKVESPLFRLVAGIGAGIPACT